MTKRGWIIFLLIIAMEILEVGNFALTSYSLEHLLNGLKVYGVPWSLILAAAFCGIDIIIIKMDRKGYLIGAWLLAIIMNTLIIGEGIWIALSIAKTVDPIFFNWIAIPSALLYFVVRIGVVGSLGLMLSKKFDKITQTRGG